MRALLKTILHDFFFFQAEDGIRDDLVTGVQTCALPIFTVWPDNHYHCFGCGAHGDVTDLEQARRGGTRAEAAERLGAERRGNVKKLTKVAPHKDPIYQLSPAGRELMLSASATLREGPELGLRVLEHLPLG